MLAFGLTEAADVPITGDWDIDTYQSASGDNFYVEGSITVLSGGHLDLTNCNIIMKCQSDGQYTLRVDAGGRLTMSGGMVTAEDSTKRYKVELHGRADIDDVTVRDTWGTGPAVSADPPLTNMKGGIQIYSSNVKISNCTLERGLLCMVYVKDSTPTISDNDIQDVIYNVVQSSHSPGNPSRTEWSATAYGVLLDNSPAQIVRNTFDDIGDFDTMASVYYYSSSTNDNFYYVCAAAVGARSTSLNLAENTVTDTGVLIKASDSFNVGGNTVRQNFYRRTVAGFYGYQADGSSMTSNNVQTSGYGIYVKVTTTAAGGKMTFDVIIDNNLKNNDLGGIFFHLDGVTRNTEINVSQSHLDQNGRASPSPSSYENCGLLVRAEDSSADVTVIIWQNTFLSNTARGAYIDAASHSGAFNLLVANTNLFQQNGFAGLKVYLNAVSGNVDIEVTNATFTGNRPNDAPMYDLGALCIQGGSLTAWFDVKMADVDSGSNEGRGLSIRMVGNTATRTSYTLHECDLNDNLHEGIYIYDNYGANAQNAVYDLKNIVASRNNAGIYIHSSSDLGNIAFGMSDIRADDSASFSNAIDIELSAASFNPKSILRRVVITYASATAGTGLAVQGDDDNNRWKLELLDSYIVGPRTCLQAEFCDVKVSYSNLTGGLDETIQASDSFVDVYFSAMPELAAQVLRGINCEVKFYKWFNLTLVAWQNGEPIRNMVIDIKRLREPKDEIHTAPTDDHGALQNAPVPYWIKDNNNDRLKNDELEAFLKIGDEEPIKSRPFNFNDSKIIINDPDVPILIVNTPQPDTVQKSRVLEVRGEIRDTHSGVIKVEVTIDRVVWHNASGLAKKVGKSSARFNITIPLENDGVYTLTIRGWDVARFPNETLGVAEVEIEDIRVDSEPPFLQIIRPGTQVHITNKVNYTLAGETETSKNLRRLTINDEEITGIYERVFTKNVRLIEGTNTFIIIAEDLAGNIAVATRQIIHDPVPPTLIVITPVPGFSSSDKAFEISGDTEQTANVTVKLDDDSWRWVSNRGGPRFYHVISIAKEGVHTITIRSTDEAGNVKESEITVKYDTTPPELNDIIPLPESKPTNNQRVYVSGRTDEEVEQVKVNDVYYPVVLGSFTMEVTLLEGEQTITIRVEDAAGNWNSTTRAITVDLTSPTFIDMTVEDSDGSFEAKPMVDEMVINKHRVVFRGKLKDKDIQSIKVRVANDNRTGQDDPDDREKFYRGFNLEDGENLVVFYAKDIAGNERVHTFHVHVDATAPSIDYSSPPMGGTLEATVRDETVIVSGQMSEPGVVLRINDRYVSVIPGSLFFQTTVPLLEGRNNIAIVMKDPAGNEASQILHVTFAPKEEDETSIGSLMGKVWWVFAIVVALAIVVPLTIHNQRDKWVKDHPELEGYDPKLAKDGYYEYEGDGYDDYYDDDYNGGGY